jgi:hypothetical protein
MNTQKVIAGFFIIMAMTLNFGFFYGDIDNFSHHSPYELFATIVVNLIATILKLGDKTQLGSVLLATSLVADIQLITAALIWGLSAYVTNGGIADSAQIIVSLSGGALMANIVSVILFMGDTLKSKR